MQEEGRRLETILATRNNLEEYLQKKLKESSRPVTGDAGAAHQAIATAVGSVKEGAQSIFGAILFFSWDIFLKLDEPLNLS